jgi:hypothetical protein
MPCPSHPPWFDHPNNGWWRGEAPHYFMLLLIA